MKTIIKTIAMSLLIASCTNTSFLPIPGGLGETPYGSLIKVRTINKGLFDGELLAVDSTGIYVYDHNKPSIQSSYFIPKDNIRFFHLETAKPINSSINLPVLIGFSISHGIFGFITLPINFLWYGLVRYAEDSEHTITHKNLSMEELSMYARFPQGIPSDLFENY